MSYRSASSKTPELSLPMIPRLARTAMQRASQVAGAVGHAGIWNPDEWFPSMIIISTHLCAIPDSLGPVFSIIDWVPVDLLPGVLFELAQEQQHSTHHSGSARIFHPINPQVVSWKALRGTVASELQSHTGTSIETMSLRTWISRVRKNIESGAGSHVPQKELEMALRAIPAAKLLDFYEDLLTSGDGAPNRLETTETIRSSEKLQQMEGIKSDWMRKWIREWMVSRD